MSVLKSIHTEKPLDFLIFDGDVCQYSASNSLFEDFFASVAKNIPIKVFPVLGNHDVYSGDIWQEDWLRKLRYTLETDIFFFIFNNSYYTGAIDSQTGEYEYSGLDYVWLEAQLQKAEAVGKIPVIVAHQIEPSSYDSNFDSLAAQYGVSLVMRGHTHIAVNQVKPGTNYFIANAGAFVISYENTYGITIIEMTPTGLISTNRQYTMADGTFTESSASVVQFEKQVAADYVINK